MENETREVTYIAITLMILAVIIGFISYTMGLTREVSANRNDEITASDKVEKYREFNAYDAKTLSGDDVIELIRLQYDSGIDIFVDTRTDGTSTVGTSNSISPVTCGNCSSKNGDHRIFNLKMYMIHKNTGNNYFNITPEVAGYDSSDLRNWFPAESRYRAYLVYNNEDVAKKYIEIMNKYAGISHASSESGKLLALDSAAINNSPIYEVTGVILINYSTLGIATS